MTITKRCKNNEIPSCYLFLFGSVRNQASRRFKKPSLIYYESFNSTANYIVRLMFVIMDGWIVICYFFMFHTSLDKIGRIVLNFFFSRGECIVVEGKAWGYPGPGVAVVGSARSFSHDCFITWCTLYRC